MTCEHCKTAITEEVDRIAGVEAVQVDLEAKIVRVSGAGVDDAAVVAAIDEAGYDAVRA
jgi:copper chaperone